MGKSDDALVGRDADPGRADTQEPFLTKTLLAAFNRIVKYPNCSNMSLLGYI